MPTAAQIEADLALPTFQVEIYTGGVWVDVSQHVVDVDGEISGSTGDGIGFGVAYQPSQSVTVAQEAFSYSWDHTPIRTKLGFNGVNPQHFIGLIDGLDQERVQATWNAKGFTALIEAVGDIRSPLFYRRPVATATTITSVENPADSSYGAGLINYILWQCGGRPWEQTSAYPNAVFYYRCETAILAPEWSWVNGGNALQAILDLCAAAGGILYQDFDGTVRYVEPFSLASGSPTFHYTDTSLTQAQRVAQNVGHYGGISRSVQTKRLVVDVVKCKFVQRRLQGVQEVYSDKSPRLIEPGVPNAIQLPADLTLPTYRIDRIEHTAGLLRANRKATTSELTVATASAYAQQLNLTLTNTLSERMALYDLKVYGQPLIANEEGSASYGTAPGSYPRIYTIPDSPYVQSRSYAERLCWMYHDFYSDVRPIVTLTGCGFDPRRTLGEIITLTCSDWSMTAETHRIVAIRVSRTGVAMELDLVPTAGLPVASDFFQFDTVYADAAQRQLTY
jgi:hypothetical protein